MKAISLWQPWATLIALGCKHIETRGWPTSHRGPLAIHASLRSDKELDLAFQHLRRRHDLISKALVEAKTPTYKSLPFGAIVAVCTLEQCVPTQELSSWALSRMERDCGNYAYGRYGWVLTDIRRLEQPIVIGGRMGLWHWNEEGLR
ncbi:2-oxoglutarate dehydrogenase E1 [Verrucomicrobia bacterium LW23]|nr:2-oxoglutarate dehydrogenase E1 [Verrucomicrobia bacterium LW23]